MADVVRGRAAGCRSVNGDAQPGDVARARERELVDAFADAAGVPIVVARRRAVHPARGPRRPPAGRSTSWLSRLRPDPLRRLHLDLGRGGKELTARRAGVRARGRPRCSGPGSTPRCGRSPTTSAPSCRRRGRTRSAGRRSRGCRPQRRARQGGRWHRPRGRPHAAVVAGGPRAAVAADARRAGRRAVAAAGSRCWATSSSPAPADARPLRPAAAHAAAARRGRASASLLGLLVQGGGPPAPRGAGPGRPTGGCGRRSPRSTERLVHRAGRGRGRGLPHDPRPGLAAAPAR